MLKLDFLNRKLVIFISLFLLNIKYVNFLFHFSIQSVQKLLIPLFKAMLKV